MPEFGAAQKPGSFESPDSNAEHRVQKPAPDADLGEKSPHRAWKSRALEDQLYWPYFRL